MAFRNGKSILNEECIHLEMDKFGKVSLESEVTVKPNPSKNLSEEKWEKKENRNNRRN